MMSRRSECRRYGKSSYEDEVKDALRHLKIPFIGDCAICFICKEIFRVSYDYPDQCGCCQTVFKQPRMFSMPDIILEEQMTIIEIYGDKYHDKPDKIKSDLNKNKKLAELGYKIYIIKASEIDRLTQSSLRSLVLGIYASSMTMEKYNHIIAGEKELPLISSSKSKN